MGPSGSGKSTLMHCCAGLDTADSGIGAHRRQRPDPLKDKALTQLRRDEIGFVFQSFNLVPTLTAEENILLPLAIAGRKPDPEWYAAVIATVDLGGPARRTSPRSSPAASSSGSRSPGRWSSRPRIVFADEPTGNLDSRSGAEILELLRSSVDDHGQTVVIVTHDPVAAAYCDRVLFLADGRIVEELRDPTRESVLEVMARLAEPPPRLPHDQRRPQEPPRPQGPAAPQHLRDRARRRVRGGHAGLLRHAEPQLHRAVRLDGRRRRRPAPRCADRGRDALGPDAAARRWSTSSSRWTASPGWTATSTRSASTSSARTARLVGGLGPPSIGGNWTDAPSPGGVGPGDPRRARRRTGVDEVLLDDATAEKAGYEVGDTVELLLPRGTAQFEADAGRHPRLPGGRLAQRRDPDALGHAERPGAVPGRRRRLQRRLGDRRGRRLPGGAPRRRRPGAAAATSRRSPATRPPTTPADDLLEAIGFITTFLLVFAGIALVVGAFIIVNTFSILVAQRSRELALLRALGASRRQVTWSVQLEAFVARHARLDHRPRPGCPARHGSAGALRPVRAGPVRQPLVFSPRTVVASYVVGVLVTMAAAYFPARRTGRISPVQALSDDIALPETSIRRRLLLGLLLAAGGLGLARRSAPSRRPPAAGLRRRRRPRRPAGVASASPVISRPLLRRRGAASSGAVRHGRRRSPARTRCATRGARRPPPRR